MLQIQLNNAIAIADSIKSVYFADSTKSNIKNSSVIIANDQFFSFTIVEYHIEKSKDSNQSSTTISLEKNTLYFTYEYRGFPGSLDEKKQIALNNSTIHTIKTKLKELSLYRNYKKTFLADSRGPSTTTGFNLTILIDSNEYNLKVEVEGQQSINVQIYLNIRSFYSYVKNLFPLSKNK